MASPYQSPTKRIAAEVAVDGGDRLVGDLHLRPNILAPGGYDSVAKMLNNEDPFYPLSDEGRTVALVAKGRTVSLSYVPEARVAEAHPVANRVQLEARLSDGRTLSGWVILELPRAYPRTLDFLNGPESFLPIHDGTRVHLVNRAHIRTVHPLD